MSDNAPLPRPAQPLQPGDEIHIGLMSGTSMDGVDGVMLAFAPDGTIRSTLGHAFLPMPAALRERFAALQHPTPDELHTAALAAQQLAELYAACTDKLLQQTGIPAHRVRALGAHGQTVRHMPLEGWSLQLLDAPRLAERTGIDVIADLRSADLAAGGHGAPLMPAFHAHLFAAHPGRFGILNLGGIANLSIIDSQHDTPSVSGFDTGPANTLLDTWIERQQGHRYDHQGQWAATGKAIPALLERLLAEPYFSQAAPKSTGRDLFNLAWLERHLQSLQMTAPSVTQSSPASACATPHASATSHGPATSRSPATSNAPASTSPAQVSQPSSTGPTTLPLLPPEDVQATLLALTAQTTAAAIRAAGLSVTYVCGGGAENPLLMQAIQQAAGPDVSIQSTRALGIDPQAMEASGFAWLARQRVHNTPIALPSITGARHPSILGAWHSAPR